MSGSAVKSDRPAKSRARARVKLRRKAQLTLPEEIRIALRVEEGDQLEFSVGEDGTVRVRGYVSIPTDQVWRYSQRVTAAGAGQGGESAAGSVSRLGAADA